MDLMQNHYTALINIKPTINTRVAPRKHVSSQRPKTTQTLNGRQQLQDKLINSQEYSEQREAFKRIAALKGGYTDSKKPDTYHLATKMSENKFRKRQQSSY